MRRLRLQYNAPVVLTFSLLALGALLLGMATGEQSTRLLFCVYRAPLTDPLTYVRMVGHVLITTPPTRNAATKYSTDSLFVIS